MSSIIKNLVLLLKAQTDDDKYEIALRQKGLKVIQVKTLHFKFKNIELLKEKLFQPNDFAGLVLSSPRCVTAVKLASDLPEEWKLKENYVVGEATYESALSELGIKCLGKETGNADNLSKLLLKDSQTKKVFLYPHGNLKMDILKGNIADSQIFLEEVEVYDTISNDNIEREFEKVTNSFKTIPEYVVFFSPSGIKAISSILRKLPLESIKLIAIGPTTETAMIDAGLKVFDVPKSPTPIDIANIF